MERTEGQSGCHGGQQGIGFAVVQALVEEGAHVIAGARLRSDQLVELSRTGSQFRQFLSSPILRSSTIRPPRQASPI